MSATADDHRLTSQAAALRDEAQRLLYHEGLFSVVSAIGPVAVVGSFTFDLMTWPDLDVNVQLHNERDVGTFFDLAKQIATTFQVLKLTFSNQFIRADVPFDHGLYAGIRLQFGDREWKIDLWGYGDSAFQSHLRAFEDLKRRLEGVDRLAVLRIKDEVSRRPEYRFGVSSVDIYAAVADDRVQTVAQFDEWLKTRRAAA